MKKRKEPKDVIDQMLQGVEKVEAPMFLLTKIQARISQQLEEQVPTKYIWVGAFSLMILLVLNVWTIQETSVQKKDSITVMVEEMHLVPNNSFF